jgi:DNA polymerase III delta prime subunit
MNKDILWVEKYRPQTIQDCILPETIKDSLQEFVDNNHVPNLLFSGGAGIGKTTSAVALCKETNSDYIIINGSEESGIDLLRSKLDQYCSSVSMTGGRKVVIIDEADYLNPSSTQPAMRGFIERFSSNCSFIFTCNFKNRIIDPIHSRCAVVDYKIAKKDSPLIASAFFKKVCKILEEEGIKYNQPVIVELLNKFFPDFRRILNELQRYSVSGEIDTGILASISDQSIDDLMVLLKDKKFNDMRKWVAENLDNDPTKIFKKLYEALNTRVVEESLPAIIITLADYQYKSAFVADQELNMVACLTEVMADASFK